MLDKINSLGYDTNKKPKKYNNIKQATILYTHVTQ